MIVKLIDKTESGQVRKVLEIEADEELVEILKKLSDETLTVKELVDYLRKQK